MMDLRKAELEWLARQELPMWGGHLERGEPVSNPDMRSYIADGLIKAVESPRVGYIITEKGRQFVRGSVVAEQNHEAQATNDVRRG